MKNILVVLLIILAFLGGYFLSQNYNFKIETKTPTPTLTATISPTNNQRPLVGGDSDEHGCKGSAGYSWCEEKQKCLRTWEEPCGTPSLIPTVDETESLKTIIKQLLIEEHGESANGLTITVSKIQGDYARGGASETGGGAMWLATKKSGNWQLVFDGNGVPDCNKLKTTYLFPTAILTGICD